VNLVADSICVDCCETGFDLVRTYNV